MTNTIKIPKTARAFNRSGASQAAGLDISKAVDRADMGIFFTNLSLIKFQVRYGDLFLLF